MQQQKQKMHKKKKRRLRWVGFLAALCVLAGTAGMVFSAAGVAVQAADAGYTIRIYPGNQGVFLNSSGQQLSQLEYIVPYSNGNPGQIRIETPSGTQNAVQYSFSIGGQTYYLQLVDSDGPQYYPRGFRISGRDDKDNAVIQSQTITVDRDLAFVVQYGVTGGMQKYTVQYLEQGTGRELLKTAEYYGEIGDKPIVSFRYIEGYLPNAYNEKKTITANEADNVFKFVYHPVVTPTPAAQQAQAAAPYAVVPVGDNGTFVGENGTDAAGGVNMTATDAGDTETGAGLQPLPENPFADPFATGTEESGEEPREIIDLDEEEIPLAAPQAMNMTGTGENTTDAETGNSGKSAGLNYFLYYVLGAAAAGAAAALIIILLQKWKDRK